MKKYITWGLLAFAFYMIVQFPDDSIQLLTNTRDLLGRVAEGSASFVRGTFGQ